MRLPVIRSMCHVSLLYATIAMNDTYSLATVVIPYKTQTYKIMLNFLIMDLHKSKRKHKG